MTSELLRSAWAWLSASPFVETLLSLGTAFVLGTLIGFERQWRQRSVALGRAREAFRRMAEQPIPVANPESGPEEERALAE